ncbi:butanediol dehydrogenase [Streptomyces sp. WAC 06783]|uniref:2,3-butanediol dehydrogenase n=1 Tax=Streptomyces sp. WAC 06783 TaxID=2203211 RepID=UPI000F736111|nr:2,3-butanediol dehydrogenase [Streptomyces sp. WAC 06783]RSO03935.1 butanediol dehydrogenase [Streptomyces sp. WAC 06783]
MKAVVWYGPRDVRVTERAVPVPGPHEVLLQVAYCGICGSDLHEYADGPHAIPTRAPHPASGARAPLVLGHEFCGTVAAVGDGVAADSPAAGDRVAVEPHYRCGTCPRCRAGEYNICRHFGFAGLVGDGGPAEYAVVPSYMAHRLPPDVPLEQAALFEPASVALHALRRAGDVRSVAVVGLGPVGLLTVLLAARRGIRRIIAADVRPDRLALAGRLGATDLADARDAADPRRPDARAGERIRRLAGVEGVDAAFEAVGSQSALDACLAATRRGGRTVLIGLAPRLAFDALALVNNEQSIVASVGYRDTYPELIRLVREDGLDLTPVVTSVVPLEAVVERGFTALLEGAGTDIKILAAPGRPRGAVFGRGVAE